MLSSVRHSARQSSGWKAPLAGRLSTRFMISDSRALISPKTMITAVLMAVKSQPERFPHGFLKQRKLAPSSQLLSEPPTTHSSGRRPLEKKRLSQKKKTETIVQHAWGRSVFLALFMRASNPRPQYFRRVMKCACRARRAHDRSASH